MVVSRVLKEHFEHEHKASITYIPNGTEIRDRLATGKLAAWDLKPDNYILFLGRFSPEKNCHMLIDAFERSETRAKLVLAGGSSYSDRYVKSLHEHQSDRVHLLNYVFGDALRELLTNAMLFVLPSDMEGLSLALLDAMAAGVCVLASDIPENVELVDGAGFTFKRGDVEDLARMLRLLLADPSVRTDAAGKAQDRIRKHYLWPGIANQIEAEYLEILGWSNKAEPDVSTPIEEVPESEPAA
jgi:glycosyltransferase involved in cell wall biosynthesis